MFGLHGQQLQIVAETVIGLDVGAEIVSCVNSASR